MSRLIYESVQLLRNLQEAEWVTANNQLFPRYNTAIILAGGAGSGKGYILNHNVMIDAKTFDVDRLKDQLVRMILAGKIDFSDELTALGKTIDDLKNDKWKRDDDLLGAIHAKIEELGWEDAQKDLFFSTNEDGHRPNVVFDTTGKNVPKLIKNSAKLKAMGYHTMLVWVVTNREVALLQNITRPRTVRDSTFHAIHNKILDVIPPFITSTDAKDFDECWIIFGGDRPDVNMIDTDLIKAWKKDRAHKLKKNSDGSFELTGDLYKEVMSTIGEYEPTPDNPSVYKSKDELRQELDIDTANTSKAYKKELRGRIDSLRHAGKLNLKR